MNEKPPRAGGSSWWTILDLGRDPLRRPLAYFEKYGDTFGGHMLGKDFIITRDPAVFEDVLIKQHKSFIKDDIARGLGVLLGRGLLTSEGETWKKSRRVILPHLQAQTIERYLEAFQNEAERTLDGWADQGIVDLHAEMTALTVRITLRTVFGTATEDAAVFERSMRAVMDYFAGFAGTLITLPLWLPTPTTLRFLRAREHLTRVVRRTLALARETGQGDSVLQSLLAAQDAGELSEQQLIDEVLTLLLAGHETTALALTYTLALLADAPVEQAAVREEIASLPAPGTLGALRAHTGLARVIKESMRLYPESWAIGREALEGLEVGGWFIEPRTQVYLYQWAAHMNPARFERPEEFLPARWTPEFEAALPRCAYTPFGGGPRICIGNHFAWAELIVVLAAALSRYELQPLAPFRPRLLASITARPRDPVPMRVVRIGGTGPASLGAAARNAREVPPAA